MSSNHQKTQELIVLMDPMWGKLSPVQQSTSSADTLLGNVFEPLIDLNPAGGVTAGSADIWEVSEDDRIFRFHIRPGIKFSDGTPLTANLYRQSLLDSVVSKHKDSFNPNALDVLYRLEGFSLENARKKTVSGLIANGEWLEMRFKNSFRTALFELTGTRYAPWIWEESTQSYLGTGPYKIISHQENVEVIFEPNPMAWRKPQHSRVKVLGVSGGLQELCNQNAHLYVGVRSRGNEQECSGKPVGFLGGGISGHLVIALNGLPEKIFSNPHLRLAMQYAIHQVPRAHLTELMDPRRYSYDAQFFPPLWPGRLEENEAESIIALGKQYLPALVQASKRNPIRVAMDSGLYQVLKKALGQLGVQFSNNFQSNDPNKGWLDAAYGRIDYDINILAANVVGSDPDGVYHLLGRHGSLQSPPIFRPGVASILEHCRNLHSSDNLHKEYMIANRKILEEVPLIHLALISPGTFYKYELLKPQTAALNSDRFQFDLFHMK